MQETQDMVLQRYLSDNERYADLINGFRFQGQQVLKGSDFSELDTRTGYRGQKGKRSGRESGRKRKQRYRDLFRKAAFGVNFMVIGIENQKEVHYLMPLRVMGYDADEYERQAAEIKKRVRGQKGLSRSEFLSGFGKDSRLHPCVTLVLYYGEEWDGSRDLHGLLDFTDIPDRVKELVNNYEMHLLEVRKLEDTDVFRTDLKQVFDFIRCSEDKVRLRELVQQDDAYKNMDEDAYDVAVTFAKADELLEIKGMHVKGGKVNMCRALTEMLEDERMEGMECGLAQGLERGMERGLAQGMERGLAQGMEQGMERGLAQGMEQGIERGMKVLIETYKEFGIPGEEVSERLKQKFGVSEETVQEMINKYF